MKHLTDEEILDVATRHCEFTAEGTYHLRKFRGWAIVQVVRDCFDLAELCRQAEAAGDLTVPAGTAVTVNGLPSRLPHDMVVPRGVPPSEGGRG